MLEELDKELCRHSHEDVIAVQGEDRIRLMNDKGDLYGDLPAKATRAEIEAAIEWLATGLRIGIAMGKIRGVRRFKELLKKRFELLKELFE